MNCDEYQSLILADPEDESPVDVQKVANTHLANCVNCQAFARQLRELDAELATRIKPPGLSADFDQRLARRIQAETTVLPATERAERKRQMETEFATGLAQLRRRIWMPDTVLEALGGAVPVALVGWFAWQLVPLLAGTLKPEVLGNGGQNVLFALLAAAVFVVIGLTAAFPQRVRNLWPAN